MSALIARLQRALRSRYLWSVGAQGSVSGFHFVLNLLLLRLVTPYEYGSFAFAFVLAMFASAINNALIATPLTVWTPIIKEEGERRRSEALFGTLNLALFLVLLGGGLTAAAQLDTPQLRDTALGTSLFVAVYAARQYSRTTGYARLRPLIPAAGDLIYVVCGTLLIGGWLLLMSGTPPIGAVLVMLAIANLAAMLAERLTLRGSLPRSIRFSIEPYRAIWRETRWALAGSLTTLFLAQAHSVVVTARLGPDAFAPLAAGFVLFGPVRIALLTWQNMVKPELAIALDEGRTQAVRAQLLKITLVTAGAVAVLGTLLALVWPLLHAALYAARYADAPMAHIVALWAVITLFAACYNAPSAALQALREFRRLALASVAGAVLSGAAVLLLLSTHGAVHTLYGVLMAELFMAVWLTRLLLRCLDARAVNTPPDRPPQGPTGTPPTPSDGVVTGPAGLQRGSAA